MTGWADADASALLNARLILLLANQVGDAARCCARLHCRCGTPPGKAAGDDRRPANRSPEQPAEQAKSF